MSASGTKRTSLPTLSMSALGVQRTSPVPALLSANDLGHGRSLEPKRGEMVPTALAGDAPARTRSTSNLPLAKGGPIKLVCFVPLADAQLSGLAKHGVAGQPKDRINDEVGRTLDEVPNNIEVDPELRTEQRQNESAPRSKSSCRRVPAGPAGWPVHPGVRRPRCVHHQAAAEAVG